eukprot:1457620-Amphidinium_carterae.1
MSSSPKVLSSVASFVKFAGGPAIGAMFAVECVRPKNEVLAHALTIAGIRAFLKDCLLGIPQRPTGQTTHLHKRPKELRVASAE